MSDDATRRHATALDFAHVAPFAESDEDKTREELRRTFAELKECFPDSQLKEAAFEAGLIPQASPNTTAVNDALLAFACIIIESDRPRLAAKLVGKLVGLELVTKKKLSLRDLARSEGVSKQAVARNLANYSRSLGLTRSDCSDKARESHRFMNRRNYSSRPLPQ